MKIGTKARENSRSGETTIKDESYNSHSQLKEYVAKTMLENLCENWNKGEGELQKWGHHYKRHFPILAQLADSIDLLMWHLDSRLMVDIFMNMPSH